MFGWFRRSARAPDYRLWMTEAAKEAALGEALSAPSPTAEVVVLVAHFGQTVTRLAELLAGANVPWLALVDRPLARSVRSPGAGRRAVYVVHSDQLRAESHSPAVVSGGHEARVIAVEAHVAAEYIEAVSRFAEALACRATVEHWVSLEDPVVGMFVGSTTRQALEALGMGEDDAMTHRWINQAIAKAQAKIAGRLISNLPADSARDWLRLNCPAVRGDAD